jgi:hypothetical protein
MSAIIAVHIRAMTRKPTLATPVATSTTAITCIGTEQAIIIQPCLQCAWPRSALLTGGVGWAASLDATGPLDQGAVHLKAASPR